MPVDRVAVWIKKNGDDPRVKKWLTENPPPEGWTESPAAYAYAEMPETVLDDDGEIDEPLLPEPEDDDLIPVSRQEHDALRQQVADTTRKLRNAIKRARTAPDAPPPPPPPEPDPLPKKRTGLAAILEPLARRK